MPRKPCSIDGCALLAIARGWCSKHYTRWKNHGDPMAVIKGRRTPCSVTGCLAWAKARGFCGMHYKRQHRHGDTNTLLRAKMDRGWACTVPGCSKPGLAKGLCTNHYALNQRNGRPETVRQFVGFYIKDGYRYVLVSYRHYEPEHRLVMERHLGRKLGRDEHVHHKDENTLNNTIENLEVVTAALHMNLHRAKINRASALARRSGKLV